MTHWEIDVEMLVRKALHFVGSGTDEIARRVALLGISGDLDMYRLVKGHPIAVAGCASPVETIIDNAPQTSCGKADSRMIKRSQSFYPHPAG